MIGCGHGYGSPASGTVPALDAFLRSERNTFSCADLPSRPTLAPLTGPQVTWRYLITMAGCVWWFTGPSWSTLVLTLSGLFFGASVVLAYGLARLLVGPMLATLVAAAVLTSPLHLTMLPHVRDYSKAPFMLALWLLLGLIVAAPLRPRRVLVLAAAYGVILGIGSGFRNDLLIAGSPFLLAVACLPVRALANLGLKVKALAVAAVTFLVAAWPLLGAYSEGGGASMQHVAILGLTSYFDEPLGVAPSVYEFGHAYDDSLAAALIANYVSRRQHIDEPIAAYDRRYDVAASALIRDFIRTFPADVLARAYASVIKMATLPTSDYIDAHELPFVGADSSVGRFYQQRTHALEGAKQIWPMAVALALLVASAMTVRLATYVGLIGLYFAGYPAIQFAGRHYFHLSVITPLAMAFVVHRTAAFIRLSPWRLLRSPKTSIRDIGLVLGRVAVVSGGAILLVPVPVALARVYQDRRVASEIRSRLGSLQEPVTFSVRDGTVRGGAVSTALDVRGLPGELEAQRKPGTARAEYLVAQIGGPRCELARIPVRVQYDAPFEEGGFTETMWVDTPAEERATTTVMLPVFFRVDPGRPSIHFRGLEVPHGDEGCVEQISRIVNLERFGVLFAATLPLDWRSRPLHQRLLEIEPHFVGPDPTFVASPPGLRLTHRLLTASLVVPETLFRAGGIRPTPAGGWSMNGEAREPMSYLLQFKSVPLTLEGRFVVQGVLHGGGLTIGILRDNRWLLNTQTVEPGPFVAVLATPSPGPGSFVVANNLQISGSLKNDFEITRLGWLASDEQR
jgi:hypothetical protein